MRLRFSEFLALAAFAGWFINYMKFKKTWAKWLFGIVCLGSICYIIFFTSKDDSASAPTASTSGNNSPAIIQSATTSGSNSTVIQAASGSTVNTTINNGITGEQMRKLLDEHFDTPKKRLELSNIFTQGYALVGVANGSLVWVPRLKNVKFSADWDKTTIVDEGNDIVLELYDMHITEPSGMHFSFDDVSFNYPRVENVVFKDNHVGSGLFYFLVLDLNQKIFVIGFK